jgi:hypothetical protein
MEVLINMVSIKNKLGYKAFGLTILSEVPLPELPHINLSESETDIVIEKSNLLSLWSELDSHEDFFITRGQVVFHVPETAIFLIQEGKRIVVSPFMGSDEDEIRLYILGTCIGAILMHRRILPLHGSAIAINGKAYAIIGDSGAGKSTLASTFLKRGHQLLSDDVIPVTLNDENIPIVTPAYPQQKLWLESLTHLGMESNNYQPLFVRETKFAVPVQSHFASKPLPLAGIFELVKGENYEIDIQPVHNLQRFYKFYHHTYRNFFLVRSGLMEWHFNISAKIINKIDLYQIRRPTTRFTADDLLEMILTTLKMEEDI